ncbi:taurine ABC transporter ATP-binding subunit, partial [Acinetobacter baumannii]
DEPFAALDALTRETVQELLLTLWGRSGKTVLIVTHDIEEALFLATRVVVMAPRPGRIVDVIATDFGRRFLAGEATRALKSDPAFIRLREQV